MSLIRIDLPKCRLYLTQAEMYKLLAYDREIYMAAIERGKALKRSEAAESRERPGK